MNQGCCTTEMDWQGIWNPFVRLNYQFGMLLGKDEFEQESGYILTKHRLSQRLFVGWGMVWGGQLTVDPVAGTLTVAPLFALDELGRELWGPQPCTIDLFQWLSDNQIADGTAVTITAAYQPCSIAPVPAMAAPCDDAATPTQPSRILETVQCDLTTDAVAPPIDLCAGTDASGADLAARFATLVELISTDAYRPLVLGTVTAVRANPPAGQKLTATVQRNGALPDLDIVGAQYLRVTSAVLVAGTPPKLDVTFNRPPASVPADAFSVLELSTTGVVTELTKSTPAPKIDGTTPTLVHVTLTRLPASGAGYLIRVAGTGDTPVLATSSRGPVVLGDGSDYSTNGTWT